VNRARCLTLLFSFFLHGGMVGFLFMFSADSRLETERVYHVALADFAEPGVPQNPSAPEVPEAVAEAPPPVPAPEPPVVEPKAVSAVKPASPRPRPTPKPRPPAVQTPEQAGGEQPSDRVQTSSGPRPQQYGELSAYDQDHVDQRPSISRRVEPEYPVRARRMNVEGTVFVELIVDAGGFPKACAVRSAEPPGYFEKAALEAAQRMRFIPGKLGGRPVNTLVLLPFAFRLR
jgi:protein TonB